MSLINLENNVNIDYDALLNISPSTTNSVYRTNQQNFLQAILKTNIDILNQLASSQSGGQTNNLFVSNFENAVLKGRAFSAGTRTVELVNDKYLKYKFSNPVGSGKRCVVIFRQFQNTMSYRDQMLINGLVVQPNLIENPNIVIPNNLVTGGEPSVTQFEWGEDENQLGQSVIDGPLPLNGDPYRIEIPRIVLPGESFGYQVQGIKGKQIETTVFAAMGIVWYEEDIE